MWLLLLTSGGGVTALTRPPASTDGTPPSPPPSSEKSRWRERNEHWRRGGVKLSTRFNIGTISASPDPTNGNAESPIDPSKRTSVPSHPHFEPAHVSYLGRFVRARVDVRVHRDSALRWAAFVRRYRANFGGVPRLIQHGFRGKVSERERRRKGSVARRHGALLRLCTPDSFHFLQFFFG